MEVNKRVSASRLEVWMTCPLQAKFQYIDKLPRPQNSSASFGNCVHHGLATYNETGSIDTAISQFLYVWREPERIEAKIDTWTKGTSFGSMKDRGIAILRAYHDQNKWETREVIATEHSFEVPLGEFILNGFVDLVEIKKNDKGVEEVHVIDYKTHKKQPYLNTLPYNIQFTIYDYAAKQEEFWVELPGMWERTKNMPVKAYWYQLSNSKALYVGAREEDDYQRLYRACKEMERACENEVFMPNISGDSCTFCAYKQPCGLPIPKDY